ncbi:MAG TPA: HipA family kinase [Bryobacteraceae bacterium]|nr:HipA family kinase [Bryobacteraceae bacterium]
MPATAVRLLRKMRGGAQAQLMEADDGHFYVVKFRSNPQGRRILLNEWFGTYILRHLGIACPEVNAIRLTPEFLESNPEAAIQLGPETLRPDPGWHFGSRYPGHPDRVAVYDFVPDTLLDKVENVREFGGMLIVDKWACNADARQSVFLRARVSEYAPSMGMHPRRVGFVALMIDHGYLFNGPHWECMDAPVAGLYFRPMVYRGLRSFDDLQPWFDRVVNFPEDVIDDALRQVPSEWLAEDEDPLQHLLGTLMVRRGRVEKLLRDAFRSRSGHFPDWAER